ncbi:MAG: RNA polymerase sigma factor [Candidatus Pacebacteria bacterium]|nr:RNA polymerase sigma factor [Candidatus Paceibacterota bacterium]
MKHKEEKSILKRLQKGEKEAFAEVYDAYSVRIFRFVYLKTGSKETAEDLTSEVFFKFWKYIELKNEVGNGKFVLNNSFSSFIYKIARNLIIDHYRKKKDYLVDIDEEVENTIVDQNQDILADITKKEEIEDLKESLSYLKDDYQEILIFRYVEDLLMSEIAEITGKKEGALRVQIHRAIKALEKVVEMRENERNK